jgi:hypothetical protein
MQTLGLPSLPAKCQGSRLSIHSTIRLPLRTVGIIIIIIVVVFKKEKYYYYRVLKHVLEVEMAMGKNPLGITCPNPYPRRKNTPAKKLIPMTGTQRVSHTH